MKSAVCFVYILAQAVYLLPQVPGNKYTYAFNILTHVAFSGVCCHWLSRVEAFKYSERLLFSYIKYLALANVLYIAACTYKGKDFAIYNTPLFAYILAIGFLSFLTHCAIKKI